MHNSASVPSPAPAVSLKGQRDRVSLSNQFLADLCTADALIHVVDASGMTDKGGNPTDAAFGDAPTVASDAATPEAAAIGAAAADEIEWVGREVHLWIFTNLSAKMMTWRKRWAPECLEPNPSPPAFTLLQRPSVPKPSTRHVSERAACVRSSLLTTGPRSSTACLPGTAARAFWSTAYSNAPPPPHLPRHGLQVATTGQLWCSMASKAGVWLAVQRSLHRTSS